jgi:hypothetical protein
LDIRVKTIAVLEAASYKEVYIDVHAMLLKLINQIIEFVLLLGIEGQQSSIID